MLLMADTPATSTRDTDDLEQARRRGQYDELYRTRVREVWNDTLSQYATTNHMAQAQVLAVSREREPTIGVTSSHSSFDQPSSSRHEHDDSGDHERRPDTRSLMSPTTVSYTHLTLPTILLV